MGIEGTKQAPTNQKNSSHVYAKQDLEAATLRLQALQKHKALLTDSQTKTTQLMAEHRSMLKRKNYYTQEAIETLKAYQKENQQLLLQLALSLEKVTTEITELTQFIVHPQAQQAAFLNHPTNRPGLLAQLAVAFQSIISPFRNTMTANHATADELAACPSINNDDP